MQGSYRRRVAARNGVVAGSVWERRMRMDEVKGGINVFKGRKDDGNAEEDGLRAHPRLRRNQSDSVSMERRKRRGWRPPEPAASGSMERSPIQLRKAKSELSNSPRIRHGHCGEIGEEKDFLDGAGNGGGVGEKKQVLLIGDGREDGGDEEEEVFEIEVEEEKKSFDDKEMDVPVEIPKSVEEEERINQIPVEKPKNVEEEERINQILVEKPKNVEEEERINKIRGVSVPPIVQKKPMPPVNRRAIHPEVIKATSVEVEEEIFVSRFGTSQNKMQNIVNLVMWRDVSKSAFVFGFGTFFLVSSSYTKDLKFSLISAISYLALIYLALIFFVKSILRRGTTTGYDERDQRYMVGEEEAIWLLRLFLPYINELLSKLRDLFSGDPATTMKLAVLLFVMARCGGSITIWTLAKLVFFGVFTIPRAYSSHSTQLAKYGKFWLERTRDGWESCTHKKAVVAAIFTLIWNLSSIVARIWAVFMLVVAVKFYQQCIVDGWSGQEELVVDEGQEDSQSGQNQVFERLHRQMGGPSVKLKKGM
ncbi:reticulon-like protein B21 [Phoenix dactylifera]|uniref:Reticulon-like protein n=1 Tax=Phoenix dactylifera TaxID=42345 RepID=A0A8B7C3A4_PHODC|nr:reticulon-like protein B21 [Phoenix dactylifera]